MAEAELQEKIAQLTQQLDKQAAAHQQAMSLLHDEARATRKRLEAVLERNAAKKDDDVQVLGDDTFVRRVEWGIENATQTIREKPRNEAMWSVEFSALGIPGLQLEFFPQGRETTKLPGFCALFLWCPAGVKIKYQLRVGEHIAAPDEDTYTSKMGHGHSDFCFLEAQIEQQTDSVVIGVEILNISYREEPALALGLQDHILLLNGAPEAMVARETGILQNRFMDAVHWRIKNIRKRINEVPRGSAICSPLFSICGVKDMLLEFYPNSIHLPGGQQGREGFCAFYVRCPTGSSLLMTLFVGKMRKGPIKTFFDGQAAKGLPEFCRVADQLTEDSEDLIVGVELRNPIMEEEEKLTEMRL